MKKFLDRFALYTCALMFVIFFAISGMYDNLRLQTCKTFDFIGFTSVSCRSYYYNQCAFKNKIDVCKYAGALYEKKRYDTARQFYSSACSLGDGSMCFKYGYFGYRYYYTNRDDEDKNRLRLAQYIKKFCNRIVGEIL